MDRNVLVVIAELARCYRSQHTFVHPTVPDRINLQDVGGQAKPYQIRQLMRLVERYDLTLEDE